MVGQELNFAIQYSGEAERGDHKVKVYAFQRLYNSAKLMFDSLDEHDNNGNISKFFITVNVGDKTIPIAFYRDALFSSIEYKDVKFDCLMYHPQKFLTELTRCVNNALGTKYARNDLVSVMDMIKVMNVYFETNPPPAMIYDFASLYPSLMTCYNIPVEGKCGDDSDKDNDEDEDHRPPQELAKLAGKKLVLGPDDIDEPTDFVKVPELIDERVYPADLNNKKRYSRKGHFMDAVSRFQSADKIVDPKRQEFIAEAIKKIEKQCNVNTMNMADIRSALGNDFGRFEKERHINSAYGYLGAPEMNILLSTPKVSLEDK